MVKFHNKSLSFSSLWVSSNERLSDFYTSSWQRGESPVPMLVVRALLAAAALAILTWSLIEGGTRYWLIYLTNWGILLVAATTVSGLAISSTFLCTKTIERTELPWYVSLYWVLFNMGVTLSVIITALYWILLYKPGAEVEARVFWLDVATHGLTSCVLLAELLAARTPVTPPHVCQPLAAGLWYALFSALYYVAGGTDAKGNPFIYEVLNWQHAARATVVVLGSVVALIVAYSAMWGLAFCRDQISASVVRSASRDPPPPSAQQSSQIV